ncbi:MAG TPA: hypothetical protein VFF30_04755 [Nitrososphaerales archaeon]|nr:hypothetical protein [Nitrososphaerales archaeon]
MEIISDPDKILQRRLHYGDSAVRRMDICVGVYAPSASLGGGLKKAMLSTLSKGVKIRYLIGIRKENLTLCKDLLAMGLSVRHLDGIQANFSVTD